MGILPDYPNLDFTDAAILNPICVLQFSAPGSIGEVFPNLSVAIILLVFLNKAMLRGSPVVPYTPLPLDLSASIDLTAAPTGADIEDFRQRRIVCIEGLGAIFLPLFGHRFSCAPDIIPPNFGLVDVALLASLMGRFGMSGRRWRSQFAICVPIIGFPIQDGVYLPLGRILNTPLLLRVFPPFPPSLF